MVDLATLVVKLEAQTAAFTEGMRRGEEATRHLTDVVGEQVNKITERFLELEAIKKAFEFTDKIIEDVARLSELSAALGITSEKLSELQYVAKLHGVDDIVQPLQRMARAAGEAEQGNARLIAAFDQLHISVADLKRLTPDELIKRVAESVSQYGDGLGKTALVQQIFGRNSAQFIATLNQGKEGLDEAAKEAAIFGATVSDKAAESVKDLHEQILRVETALTGVFKQSLVAVEPLLSGLANDVVDFIKNSDAVHVAAGEVAAYVKTVAGVISELFDDVKKLVVPLIPTFESVGKALLSAFTPISELVLPILKSLVSGVSAVLTPIVDLLGKVAIGLINVVTEIVQQGGPTLLIIAEQLEEALKLVGAGLELISSALTGFTDQEGLAKEVTDEFVLALQIVATAGATIVSTFQVVGKYIAGTVAEYELFLQLPSKADWLQHPIDSSKKFSEVSKEAQAVAHATWDDINSTFDKGDETLARIWGTSTANANKFFGVVKAGDIEVLKSVDDAINAANKKPQLQLFDEKAQEQAAKALEALIKERDKLDEAVSTFGLGSAAAEIYSVQFGKLSESLNKLSSMSTAQQEKFLELAKAAHTITPDQFNSLTAGIKAGVDISQQFKRAIIEDALALEALKNTDAIQKIDEQILKLTGHEREAAAAAFQSANRGLDSSLQTSAARAYLDQFSGAQRVAVAQSKINELQVQAVGIQDTLKGAIDEVGSADTKTQDDAIAKRAVALAQLEKLYTSMRALADASNDPALVKQAQELQKAIAGAAQSVGEADLARLGKANDYQAQYNELQTKAGLINAELADQLATIADLQSQGSISELDAEAKEDDARQRAIDQLSQIHDKMAQIAADSNNPALVEGTKKFGTSITQLHTQMDQLGKAIRDDFVNESSNAFSDFVLSTKSASAAAKEFLTGIESDLIRLINKHLFQQLFEGEGGSGVGGSGFNIGSILGLFGGGAGVDTAAADAAAGAATTDFSAGFALDAVALARGGGVASGNQYLVGEEGIELFEPDDGSPAALVGIGGPQQVAFKKAGRIIPHNQISHLLPGDEHIKQLEKRATGGPVSPSYIVGTEDIEEPVPDLEKRATGGHVEPNTDEQLPDYGRVQELDKRATGGPVNPSYIVGPEDDYSQPEQPEKRAAGGPVSAIAGTESYERLIPESEDSYVEKRAAGGLVSAIVGTESNVEPAHEMSDSYVQQVEKRATGGPVSPSDIVGIESPVRMLPGDDHMQMERRATGGPVSPVYIVGMDSPDDEHVQQMEKRATGGPVSPAYIVGIDSPDDEHVQQMERRATGGPVSPSYIDMLPDDEHVQQLERRASGGPVSPSYIVGIDRPESSASGDDTAAGGKGNWKQQVVNNHFYISAPQGTVSRATQSQIAASTARAVQMANHRNN